VPTCPPSLHAPMRTLSPSSNNQFSPAPHVHSFRCTQFPESEQDLAPLRVALPTNVLPAPQMAECPRTIKLIPSHWTFLRGGRLRRFLCLLYPPSYICFLELAPHHLASIQPRMHTALPLTTVLLTATMSTIRFSPAPSPSCRFEFYGHKAGFSCSSRPSTFPVKRCGWNIETCLQT